MSFRPRFRLSLLFVIAALVAGVSVWLRQAVLRDRNIRELLAEEYVRGHANEEAHCWNTKTLRYFSGHDYCDQIDSLYINIEKTSTSEFVNRYRGVDLGDKLIVFMFEVRPNSMITLPISLSEIVNLLKLFKSVDALWFYSCEIVDERQPIEKLDYHFQELNLSCCESDSRTIEKLIHITQKPNRMVFCDNDIQGNYFDLDHLFNLGIREYYKDMNRFSKEKISYKSR